MIPGQGITVISFINQFNFFIIYYLLYNKKIVDKPRVFYSQNFHGGGPKFNQMIN